MPVILALLRLEQDECDFAVHLGYMTSSSPARTTEWNLVKNKTMNKTQPEDPADQSRTYWKMHYWEMRLIRVFAPYIEILLGKECPCTAATLWQERSFCLRERLHWTKGNFGFVCLRMLDQKYKINILGGAFQWILFIEFYFKIHSFGRGKYFVMGWGQRSSPKMRHLRCSWFRMPSATVLKKNKLFFNMPFFPAQEVVYNKIMENTLLQFAADSSPISRLYIGPKRKTCEPLHAGLPHPRCRHSPQGRSLLTPSFQLS